MKKIASLIFMVILPVFIFYAWRYASRSHEIPCPFWLRWFVELDNPFTKANRANTIIQQSNIHPGMHVIDFGCGPGRLTIPLAERVGSHGKAIGVDIQSEMLQRAESKALNKDLKNIEFIQGKIGKGKLQLAPCERAVLVTVLGEIPDRDAALKEIYDTLKPGGILTVTEVIFDPHFQSRKTVLTLANKVGFREKEFVGNRAAFSLLLEKPVGDDR
ncbi:class I SAM-dependent methyltransferase [Salicibibacter cibi]|uniref:Class I SAM-dependent methyltransferase n=1 Tax=Salicibibacter cibi TaxID=2743001 RepID=A0A7T7CFF1_9BACI|nr:class I SAM-dependent methyltransferase [Salicibibacter cibi]QQK80087.1 class I SAM-dependent methyltransferase [Salicibibacter cibi]